MVLGFFFSLIINGIIDTILAVSFGFTLGLWGNLILAFTCILWVYFYFNKSGLAKQIVEIERPRLFKSKILSIIITLMFVGLALVFMFIEPVWTKDLLLK